MDNLMNGNINNGRTIIHKKNFKFIHDDILHDDSYHKPTWIWML
jgi:hypothetical protein